MKTLYSSSDDRLSELPDSLILEILSLMTMRDVVRTTVLSKHWKDLWTSVPCLEFELHAEKNPVRDRKFICQVLLRWKGINVRTFSIAVMTAFDGLQSDMDLWMRFATVTKVEKLYLFLPFDRYNPYLEYYLPQLVYSCSSFKELWISGCNLEIQEKVQWDNLESLYINGSCFSEDVINQVVSSAPRLEDFHLRLTRSHHNLNIASTSLKRLSVEKFNVDTAEYDPSRYATLTIRAPKLGWLRLVGNTYSECNLLMNASSLTRASLCFYEDHCAALQETLMQILPSIQLVESLTLSPCAFKMLGVMQAKYSSFPNHVKKLMLDGGPITLKEIAGLAEMFPEVETLVIDWKLDDEWWYPIFLKNFSLTTYKDSEAEPCLKQLRTVEIITYSDSDPDPSELQLIFNSLREHATMLHKTMIRKGVEELCSWTKQCNALIEG